MFQFDGATNGNYAPLIIINNLCEFPDLKA